MVAFKACAAAVTATSAIRATSRRSASNYTHSSLGYRPPAPGVILSKAAVAVLERVRAAQRGTERAEGERHDAWQRRWEEAVAAAWAGGRVDPRGAGELDRFMAAAGQRLGEEGVRAALRAAKGKGADAAWRRAGAAGRAGAGRPAPPERTRRWDAQPGVGAAD